MQQPITAPELQIEKWLNTDQDLSLKDMSGKVIMIVAFQMLCPGCVEHSIPQAKKIAETFSPNDLMIIGLHTVFEHHKAMQEISLKAFLHEYRINFPVAIDKHIANSHIPETMSAYKMRGTPTTILIDKQGYLRKQQFGHTPDLLIGAELMALILEKDGISTTYNKNTSNRCSTDGYC